MGTDQSLFTLDTDCDEGSYQISHAGMLLVLGDTAYGTQTDAPPWGRAKAQLFLGKILSAAYAGGFVLGDILDTLLARGEVSGRVEAMAIAACEAAGDEALDEIFDSADWAIDSD
jgi:hypothetical protein